MSRGRSRNGVKSPSSSETEQLFINIKQKHYHNKRESSSSSNSDIEEYSNKKDKKNSDKKYKKDSDKKCKKDSDKKCKKDSKKDSSSSSKKSKKAHSSSSESERKDDCNFEEIYKYYKHRLVVDKELMVTGSSAYGGAVNDTVETIPRSYGTSYTKNTLMYNVEHGYQTSPFYVRESGVYIFSIVIDSDQASQFTLFVNGLEIPLSRSGVNSGSGQLVVNNLIKLKDNDAVVVRNSESTTNAIQCQLFLGGLNPGNNLSFSIIKIAPYQAPEECDWDEDCLSRRKKYLFKKLMEKMLCDKELMLKGSIVHGSFFSTNSQTLTITPTESEVVFDNYNNVNCLQWNPTGNNPEQVKILEDGIYKLYFLCTNVTSLQLTFYINGSPVDSSTQGLNRGAAELNLSSTLELKKNDIVTVRNHTTANPTTVLASNAGLLDAVNVILTITKIAVSCKPSYDECRLNDYHKKCYEKYKRYLLNKKSLLIEGSSAYAGLSSDVWQVIPVGSAWDWNNTLLRKNVRHIQGSNKVKIEVDGIYDLFAAVATNEAPQVGIYINGTLDPTTVFGRDSGAGRLSLKQLLKLCRGDELVLKNVDSYIGNLTTALNSGGNLSGQNTIFQLYQISGSEGENKCKYKNKL
jgi:hypothetical protein